jgi:hypothetical protein
MPCVYNIGFQLAPYHAARANYAASAQNCPIKQDAVRANPNIVLDHDSAAAREETLLADGSIAVFEIVIDRSKCTVRGYRYAVSNVNAVAGVENAA